MPARLELIDLDQPSLAGYRRFISCWLVQDGDRALVVDPGPASTVPLLVARLRERGVARLDLVLLTHIHLDHGGGTAQLLAAYPEARVYCHRTGRPHLVEPARLWAGSRQVLGPVAEVYGEPAPVPADALATDDELAAAGIEALPTPGHAPHHVSFRRGETLFVGESAGTFLDLAEAGWYLRPATPPRFVLEVALASLERLLAVRPEPAALAFAHHGLLRDRASELLAAARGQLRRWVAAVREVCDEAAAGGADAGAAALVAAARERLRASDRRFARQDLLPPDIRRREEGFTRQSLQGMVEYVLAGPDARAGGGAAGVS